MRSTLMILLAVLVLAGCNSTGQKEAQAPNIIFFLADDLGYGEVGAYGQEKISTPHMDALAGNGMLFTQHYSGAPVCAPARCVFLTGKHAGHALVRGNHEWGERGDVWDYEKAFRDPGLEGQYPMPSGTVTIAKLLKEAGYTSGIFGKWGLGAPGSEGIPTRQGFDYFFGYNCQRQAHNLYPGHLWENEDKVLLENEIVRPGTKLDSLADPLCESSYARYFQKDYAPDVIHEKALAFLREQKEGPFFLYYASPLPHVPLQAPEEYVKAYRKDFEGEEPYLGERGYFPNRFPRSAYAAMISRLDAQLGELVSTLKELGIYKNTLIIFTSDNGPTYAGGVDFEFFESSAPFANGYGRTKGFVYEGGIRVPMIASWPDHIKAGSTSAHVSAFYDFMPTFCDLAGIEIPTGTDGISLKAALLGGMQKEHDFLYWEFPSYQGQQAVRMGKWKGVRKNIFTGNMDIELYDLESDPQEMNDLAEAFPEIIKKIEYILAQEHEPATIERFRMTQLGDE